MIKQGLIRVNFAFEDQSGQYFSYFVPILASLFWFRFSHFGKWLQTLYLYEVMFEVSKFHFILP